MSMTSTPITSAYKFFQVFKIGGLSSAIYLLDGKLNKFANKR
jgi:hypothetical protein